VGKKGEFEFVFLNEYFRIFTLSENELVKSVREKGTNQIHLNRGQHEGVDLILQRLETDRLLTTSIPLRNRQEEVIGLLCLLNSVTEDQSGRESEDGRMDFLYGRFRDLQPCPLKAGNCWRCRNV
jgi:hypothetical protein